MLVATSDRPPVMIPLSELEVLVLGLEDDTQGSYEVECGCTPSICYGVWVRRPIQKPSFPQPKV